MILSLGSPFLYLLKVSLSSRHLQTGPSFQGIDDTSLLSRIETARLPCANGSGQLLSAPSPGGWYQSRKLPQ